MTPAPPPGPCARCEEALKQLAEWGHSEECESFYNEGYDTDHEGTGWKKRCDCGVSKLMETLGFVPPASSGEVGK